jgi:hypothetical protein
MVSPVCEVFVILLDSSGTLDDSKPKFLQGLVGKWGIGAGLQK